MPARLLACCLTVLGALAAHVAKADWLIDQRQQDGSFATAADVSPPFQPTAEAVSTLRALNRAAEIGDTQQYLMRQEYSGTEFVARRIIVTDALALSSTNCKFLAIQLSLPTAQRGSTLGFEAHALSGLVAATDAVREVQQFYTENLRFKIDQAIWSMSREVAK